MGPDRDATEGYGGDRDDTVYPYMTSPNGPRIQTVVGPVELTVTKHPMCGENHGTMAAP